MLFMLEGSLSFTALILTVPVGWVVVGAVIGICLVARYWKRRQHDPDPIPVPGKARLASEASLLVVAPIAILSFGTAFELDWTSEPSHPNEPLLLATVTGLTVLQVVLVTWFAWRHCARLLATVSVSVIAALWTSGAQFVSYMAITGNWF